MVGRVRRRLLRLLGPRLVVAVVASLGAVAVASCDSIGDPGPPVAVLGTGSSTLDKVAVLTCQGERVLQLSIARDVGNPVTVPGAVLWAVEADGSSAASQFTVGEPPPPGFRVVVPSTAPISGRTVVLVTTTHGSFSAAFNIRHLPADSLLHAGERLRIGRLTSLTRQRCH
jgi:hypothetical protein